MCKFSSLKVTIVVCQDSFEFQCGVLFSFKCYRAYAHDVIIAAILELQNNEATAMLECQTNPVGDPM